MRTLNFFGLSIVLGIALVSCNEDLVSTDLLPPTEAGMQVESVELANSSVCGSKTFTLWAGQTINAGTLEVANNDSDLIVTYNTTGVFGTLHLWVGSDLTLLPKNSQGTPVNGKFPHVSDASGASTYKFTIPLKSISFYEKCGSNIYVVAHAEVSLNGKNETAYAGSIPGTGTNRWYYYDSYTVACCEVAPVVLVEKLGTAFAKGNYVFTTDKKSNPENLPSLKLTNNRWGWAINLKTAGSGTYELWAGAGLNYTSKGKLVGFVKVNFTGTSVILNYTILPGYSVEESHIYAGDLKPVTLAPGQYGNTYYFNPFVSEFTASIDVTDTNGDGVWLIVHAVAYGPKLLNI